MVTGKDGRTEGIHLEREGGDRGKRRRKGVMVDTDYYGRGGGSRRL